MNGDAKDWEWQRSHDRRMTRLRALQLAERREIEARLVEKTKRCLSASRDQLTESRELLARVDTLLAVQPLRVTERHPVEGDILRKAIERVFDKWTEQLASPVPRSTSFH
jgi:hypothetical protein